jgi:hypothetical protein
MFLILTTTTVPHRINTGLQKFTVSRLYISIIVKLASKYGKFRVINFTTKISNKDIKQEVQG